MEDIITTLYKRDDDPNALVAGLDCGSSGRLVIPSQDINVKLSWCSDIFNPMNNESQYLTDLYDSACFGYARYYHSLQISDHNSQGFDGLYKAKPGDYGYIVYSDGSYETIICRDLTRNGSNTDVLGVRDEYDNLAEDRGYDLFMYTCNPEGWWSDTITWWDYI